MRNDWRRKPKRTDWRQRVFPPLVPLIPKQDVQRIQASKQSEPPNPFIIANGGLCEWDQLQVDWVAGSRELRGTRISAFRGRRLLWWRKGFYSREVSGAFLYMPSLTAPSFVDSFVKMFSELCGYFPILESEGVNYKRFTLKASTEESRRLLLGDFISFNWAENILYIYRSQGTIDMNLFRTGPNSICVFKSEVGYIRIPGQDYDTARILTEANGYWAKLVDGGFEVVRA